MPITKPGKMALLSCHSTASTAVCVDPRSVAIVPRKVDRAAVVDNDKLVNVKYARLLGGSKSRSGALLSRGVAGRALKASTALSTSCRSLDYRSDLSARTAVGVSGSARRDVIGSDVKGVVTVPSTCKASPDHPFQVVVMRVSIHCQGCAGKVKKILTKMEGVTSFTIDVDSKRVTVKGHVSPVRVLESISKVKKAEFLPC